MQNSEHVCHARNAVILVELGNKAVGAVVKFKSSNLSDESNDGDDSTGGPPIQKPIIGYMSGNSS